MIGRTATRRRASCGACAQRAKRPRGVLRSGHDNDRSSNNLDSGAGRAPKRPDWCRIHMWADRLRNRTESQCRYWQGNPARPARSARARSEGCALHDSTRRTPDKATHSQAHPHGVAGAAAVFVPGGAGKQCEPLLSFRTQGVALPLAYGRPDHGNVRLLWEYARPRIALLRGTRPHRVSTQHPELCAKYSNDEYGPLAEVCSVGTPRHTFGVVSGSGWGPPDRISNTYFGRSSRTCRRAHPIPCPQCRPAICPGGLRRPVCGDGCAQPWYQLPT